jgi:glycosyltransferase involved in cell wall biosynthesis
MAMKVIATVRTHNEADNIARFCSAYQGIADKIFVADGGSVDNTIEIAKSFPKTYVKPFHEKILVENGYWINPQGSHVNFLFDWALDEGADWIIFDDCDCVPNFMLRDFGTQSLREADHKSLLAIFTRRVYFWGSDEIFPELHKPNTSLWAFSSSARVRANEDDQWHLTMRYMPDSNLMNLRPKALHLEFPYCLLHFSWPTPESADEKIKFYRKSGVQPSAAHPNEFAGPKAKPSWFMKELPDA